MNWPLAIDSFTFLDRLKVCLFYLNKNNQLTMGKKVEELEDILTEMYGIKALAVSSGSTANQLIFELYKQRNPEKFKNTLVICPVVTWISSISPIVMAGYEIKFCDINLQDFSFDYTKLEKILDENKEKNLIIWPTALIGHCPNFSKLQHLARQYRAELWGDFCENQFSTYNGESIFQQVDFSSLSLYFSHMITSVEMGFVFIKDPKEYEFAKMFRNHGLTRSLDKHSFLKAKIENKYNNIDNQFLFGLLGTNLRPTDCHAIWGLQDIKRADKYKIHRKNIYSYYIDQIEKRKNYYLPDYALHSLKQEHVGFCIPIFRYDDKIEELKKFLNKNGVSTRPIIGGCLTLQPPFKSYHDETAFSNGMWVHNHGLYIGLHKGITTYHVDKLIGLLDEFEYNKV
jgi:CDP-6-deoxy-D-xylo-4-hexulose-3-dehydrase